MSNSRIIFMGAEGNGLVGRTAVLTIEVENREISNVKITQFSNPLLARQHIKLMQSIDLATTVVVETNSEFITTLGHLLGLKTPVKRNPGVPLEGWPQAVGTTQDQDQGQGQGQEEEEDGGKKVQMPTGWPQMATPSPQAHYDNSNGSLFLLAERLGLNAYEFDILKRISRCRKKGQFKEDLQKIKDTVDLYLAEHDTDG